MLARARLLCAKSSRKAAASSGWRANNVRPYTLYKEKIALLPGQLVVEFPYIPDYLNTRLVVFTTKAYKHNKVRIYV